MSKILVVGTSHSDGSCKKENGTERIAIKDRWQHHLGHDVETLARSGATSQQQFYALWHYLLDNKEARWDYAIIEGRHMNSVDGSFPRPMAKNKNIENFASDGEWWDSATHKDFYDFWQTDNPETDTTKQLFAFSGMQNFRDTKWYAEYATSPLHWTDNYTCNLAMCNVLMERCNDVLFLSWTWNKHHETHKQNAWAGELLQRYISIETWPALTNLKVIPELEDKKHECLCGHWTESGQKIIANKVKEIITNRGWK